MNSAKYTKLLDMNSSYLGISGLVLMENAGKEIARECERFSRIAIFCGTGNNGGDGFVAARHLSSLGKKVTVYAISGNRSDEAQKNLKIIQNLDSVEIDFIRDSSNCERIKKDLEKFDLIIDALIGIGVKGELRQPIKSVVELINSVKAFKISVDVPTPKIKADLTLSFHTAKTPDAKVVSIGIPKEAEIYCGPGDLYAAIPERKGFEHKGDFGRLLVIGGSKNFIGTPTLVAKAAYKTGVDLVTVACPGYVAERMPFDPNIIINPLNSEFYLSGDDLDKILGLNFDAVVVGSGIGTKDETKSLLKKLLRKIQKPILIDADALKLIKVKYLGENHILTPHSMEFKILFGEYEEEFENKIEMVERFSKKTNAIIVLKGPVDIISDGKKTRLNKTGNVGMTVGGTGDVLAGIIGAISTRAENFQAACAGVFLSGLTGDLCYEKFDYSFTATDVIERIPEAIEFCKKFE